MEGSPEGLPIRRIELVVRNIYDPQPPGRLGPLYRLANALHVPTRPGTVESALLLRPGGPWSRERARETARALRALGIFETRSIEARQAGDSVDVTVETRDNWTTQPEFALESADGQNFTSLALVERNLLGFGKEIRLIYRETPEGTTRSAGYHDPNVLGSRVRLSVLGGTGTEGAHQGFDAAAPFYAEDVPYAYGVRWSRITSIVRLFESGVEQAAFDRRLEEAEVQWGRGVRRSSGIYRLTGSFLARDRRFGPSRLEPGAPAAFGGGEENLHLRRVAVEIRWWRPAFSERQGVDRLGGIEDVDLGASVAVSGGFSPRWLGGTADEGYAAARLDGGLPAGPSFGQAGLELSTRIRNQPLDLVARARARWVSQLHARQTLVLSTYAVAAHRPPRDHQELLGGLSGLRAYPVRALAGTQAWRLNVEHRWWLGHDVFELISLGAVAFYDAGRTWGPGAGATGWRQNGGLGLRLALPRSGQDRVARFDVAWPIAFTSGDRPVFSFGSGQAF